LLPPKKEVIDRLWAGVKTTGSFQPRSMGSSLPRTRCPRQAAPLRFTAVKLQVVNRFPASATPSTFQPLQGICKKVTLSSIFFFFFLFFKLNFTKKLSTVHGHTSLEAQCPVHSPQLSFWPLARLPRGSCPAETPTLPATMGRERAASRCSIASRTTKKRQESTAARYVSLLFCFI